MKKRITIALICSLLVMSFSYDVLATDYTNTEVIIRIQQALNEAGYDCGTPDGKAGQKTHSAIAQFRNDHGLPEGDALDDDLAKALGVSDLVETQEVDDAQSEVTGDMNLSGDNCALEFQKYEIVKDWNGNDAIGLYYQFTNDASDSSNAMSLGFFELFQNGHSLDMTFADYNDSELNELNSNIVEDIKDGASVQALFLYELQDTVSPIDIEILDMSTYDKRKAHIDIGGSSVDDAKVEADTETEKSEPEEVPLTEAPTEIQESLEMPEEVHTETPITEIASPTEWECPNCGNKATGNFCNICGTEKPSAEWECPNCGEIVEGNFCNNCGTPKTTNDNDESETNNNGTEVVSNDDIETEAINETQEFVYTGSGDNVLIVDQSEGLYYFEIEGNASEGYFGVIPYDDQDEREQSLVNTTEAYYGTIFDPKQNAYSLEIKASDNWKITKKSVDSLQAYKLGDTITGNGDCLIRFDDSLGSATIAEVTGNADEKYFGIIPYGSDGSRISSLVNTTDAYVGTVKVKKSPYLYQVIANSDWSITFR